MAQELYYHNYILDPNTWMDNKPSNSHQAYDQKPNLLMNWELPPRSGHPMSEKNYMTH